MITFKTQDGGWEAIPKPTKKKKIKKEKAKKPLTVAEALSRWAKVAGEPTPAGIRITGITIHGVMDPAPSSFETVICIPEEK